MPKEVLVSAMQRSSDFQQAKAMESSMAASKSSDRFGILATLLFMAGGGYMAFVVRGGGDIGTGGLMEVQRPSE